MGSCLSKDPGAENSVSFKAQGNGSEGGGGGATVETNQSRNNRYTQDPVRSGGRTSESQSPAGEDPGQKGISHHAIQVALSQGKYL